MTVEEQDLLDTALGRLSEADLQPVVINERRSLDAGSDVVIRVNAPVGSELYDVQFKTKISRSSAGAIHHQGDRRLLVVSPHISDSVAEVWRDRDIHFVDSAGNMYMRWPELLVDVRGRRGPSTPRPTRSGQPLRAFKSSGLRVLFILLSEPNGADLPYREVARASGSSLGTVQWVMKELEQLGYVQTGREGRRLSRVADLFNKWVEAYALDLWPRLTLGRFESADTAWWTRANQTMADEALQWGGETAAHFLNPYLRPGKAVIYAAALPQRLVLRYRLRKADADGNVEIRKRFWNVPRMASQALVPTPLIYADLVASGDPRLLEAAAEMREHDDGLRRLSDR